MSAQARNDADRAVMCDAFDDRVALVTRRLGEDEWKAYMQGFLGLRENEAFAFRWSVYLRERVIEEINQADAQERAEDETRSWAA